MSILIVYINVLKLLTHINIVYIEKNVLVVPTRSTNKLNSDHINHIVNEFLLILLVESIRILINATRLFFM